MAVLYILSTPIGNKQDISLRAVHLLQTVEVIAAEDTRVIRHLLARLDMPAPAQLFSARAHNEQAAAQKIIKALQAEQDVIYVTDAGTPGLSDPGARIVCAVRTAGYAVTPVPGASALTALIAVAGLPEGPVHFYGFPPATLAKRRQFFSTLLVLDGYSVFYEAPHRIIAMIDDLAEVFGADTHAVLGRELTKRHEQIVAGDIAMLRAQFEQGDIIARGEFAVAVRNPSIALTQAQCWKNFNTLRKWLPPRQAAAAAAKIGGDRANALYQRYLAEEQ